MHINIKNLISEVKTDLSKNYKHHGLKGAINYLLSLIDSALRLPFAFANPTLLQIGVIQGICNLSCQICPPFAPGVKKEISFEDFKKIFDSCGYTDSLFIAGHGEPFMAKDIFRMIDYAKSKNCEVRTTTNMTLINQDVARKLVDSQFDYVYISFDAASPQLFEKIRRGAKFETVINNIKTLSMIKKERCSGKPSLFFIVTLIRENLYELSKIVELASQLGIEVIIINTLRVVNKGLAVEEQSPTNFPELAREILSVAQRRAKELGVTFSYPDYRRHHQEGRIDVCRQPWDTLVVADDGTIFPCCSYRPALGNIFKDNVKDVWNSRNFRLVRSLVRKENSICYYCTNALNQLRL
jgi:MoaA/NifB/PqqE/SkfB family radical SAM enzyme